MSERSGPQGRGASFARAAKSEHRSAPFAQQRATPPGRLPGRDPAGWRKPTLSAIKPPFAQCASTSSARTGWCGERFDTSARTGLRHGLSRKALRQAQRERVFSSSASTRRSLAFSPEPVEGSARTGWWDERFDRLSANGSHQRALRCLGGTARTQSAAGRPIPCSHGRFGPQSRGPQRLRRTP